MYRIKSKTIGRRVPTTDLGTSLRLLFVAAISSSVSSLLVSQHTLQPGYGIGPRICSGSAHFRLVLSWHRQWRANPSTDALVQAAFAICWDSAELIIICARGGRRGIHPGAHVALHLVFCPVLAAGIAFESLQLWFSGYPDSWYGGDSIATKQHAALAFTCLLL